MPVTGLSITPNFAMSQIDSSSHQSQSNHPSAESSSSMSAPPAPPPAGSGQYQSYSNPEGQDNPPSDANMSSLNLPPIRSVDGRPQPPPATQQPQPQAGQSGPPFAYYPSYVAAQTSDPSQHLRFAIPPNNDGRVMSGGRHKKEIKRRTKTGCLTCRKRRIKVC